MKLLPPEAGLLLILLLLLGCDPHTQYAATSAFSTRRVAYGFVVYGDTRRVQLCFVPLKDSTKQLVSPRDFRSDQLGEGFAFSPSSSVQRELALLDTFRIANELPSQQQTAYMGATFFSPVRLVYQVAAPVNGLPRTNSVDTLSLGHNRYLKPARKMHFVIRYSGADVLEIARPAPSPAARP